MYFETFGQMKKQLGQIEKWFDAATAHAAARSFDPNLFLGCRLAPDQFAFVRQVQIACDTLKLAAARLVGQDAPKHADVEQTIDELRVRVRSVIEYVDGFGPEAFDGAAERRVSQPRWEGKWMTGEDYFREHAVPNFYFHLAHAYAILRHNGVALGKRDYLGTLTLREA